MAGGDGNSRIEPVRCDLAVHDGEVCESDVFAEVIYDETWILFYFEIKCQRVLSRVSTP
jgi:hypothetical protein